MANFKKIDDQDFVFVNKKMTEREEKDFSDFLKARKSKMAKKQTLHTLSRTKKALA
jgi:hypothetical protein